MSDGQNYLGLYEDPTTKAYCNIWDCDQLRMIKVRGTAKLLVPYDDVEVPILAKTCRIALASSHCGDG